MGLLDFLFGNKSASNVELLSDRIWMSQEAKLNGIRKELTERYQSGSAVVLLVAHFPDVLERLTAVAAEQSQSTPVTATLADNLSTDIAANLNLDQKPTIDLIVAERHPLPSVDEKLMEFARALPCHCRIVNHLSLDDPLLNTLAGEWVGEMLKQLGMSEDEPIESQMVTRRIKAAQKGTETRASGNSAAGSAAEWIEKNMI